MTHLDGPKLWAAIQEAWCEPRKWRIAWRIADILEMSGAKRYHAVRLAGLDRPQQREAFFARLAQMRKK